ncbi:MAG: serine/threonine protein kinase [Kofleriaceae bacterium]|nr:serine/threonine protein kinase [Myxococcales bacterium]MCB9563364.1 serine/threonine protein kinase [Kofleriaceae bacterium]MCB9573654.1 serine/threonine protein kinase [Kofleriaceae bacterium]
MSFTGPLLGGRWRLGPRLGQGAQAETYLARDEQAGKGEPGEVVVKRLVLRGGWKTFDLFEREARVLAQLRHPGVPRQLGHFEEPPGTFNLVMQRMPGENLREVAKRRRLSEVELRDVLIRTLEILDYLHGRAPPVVHRDIKPTNLVRAPDGRISLVDFGGVLDAARERGGSTIVGTFGYMAPEQLHGQATAATDLYALGATVVALAGGVEPEEVPRKGLRMDLARHLPAMDAGLRAVLEQMTAPDPDQRPQRARDVMKLLASAPAPAPVKALATVTPARPPAPVRRMFGGVPEPVGTLLRLTMLAFAIGGWVGMTAARFAVLAVAWMISPVSFGLRGAIRDGATEVAAMLEEGREGFSDLARRSVARRKRAALPPGRR